MLLQVIETCIWVHKMYIHQKSTWSVEKHFPKNPLKLNFVNEKDFCKEKLVVYFVWVWIWQERCLTLQQG